MLSADNCRYLFQADVHQPSHPIGLSRTLFPGFRQSATSGRPGAAAATKKKVEGSWTGQFYCLSSMQQVKAPTASEKAVLNQCGLGLKKVKIGNTLTEEQVMNHLQGEGGFLQLKNCGGFELMRTIQNGRTLVVVPYPWSSKSLKTHVGPQARIYLRPIQRNLCIDPVPTDDTPSVFIPCENCQEQVSVHELRQHITSCVLNSVSSFESLDQNAVAAGTSGTEPQYYLYVPEDLVEADAQTLPDIVQPIIPDIDSHNHPKSLNETVENCISFCVAMSNPVEILRKIQQDIVIGRPLEVEDCDTSIEGETTFITVDRENIIKTSFEEISTIPEEELRKTLEVQFYKEVLYLADCY